MGATVIGTPRGRWYAESVKAVAFSPDGALIAVGGHGEDIVVSEALTGREVARHATGARGINAVAFSPDGRSIAWVSFGSLRVLGRDGSDAPRTIGGIPDHAHALAFSTDGRAIAVGGWYGPVRVFAVEDGALIVELGGSAQKVAFSARGDLATGCYQDVRIHGSVLSASRAAPMTIRGKTADAMALSFSPDGAALVVVGTTGAISFLDPTSGSEVEPARRIGGIRSVHGALSPDLSLLACEDKHWLSVVAIATGERLPRPPESAVDVSATARIAVRPDGRVMAMSSGDRIDLFGLDGACTWSVKTSGEGPLAFSPTGNVLAFARDALRLIDVECGKDLVERSIGGGRARGLVFSPCGKRLAVLTATPTASSSFDAEDGHITVVDLAGEEAVKTWPHDSYEVTERIAAGTDAEATWIRKPLVSSAAFSMDGRHLVTSTPEDTTVWQEEGGEWRSVRELPVGALAVGLAADGTLITIGRGGIQLRSPNGETRSMRCVRTPLRASSAALAASGGVVVLREGPLIRVIDVARDRETRFEAHAGEVHELALSGDGAVLVTAGEDASVRIFES